MRIHALSAGSVYRVPSRASGRPEATPVDRVELGNPPPSAQSLARTGLRTAADLTGFKFRNRFEWWILKGPWRSCEPSKAKEIARADGPWMSVRSGLDGAAQSYSLYESLHRDARSFQGGWEPIHGGWDDSPGGAYGSHEDRSLTSTPISLDGLKGCRLSFATSYEFERGYDGVELEASRDGQTWSSLKRYTGTESNRNESFDLGAFDGGTLQLRFRLFSDGSTQREGMSFHDLEITGRNAQGARRTLRFDAGDPARDRDRLAQIADGLPPDRRLLGLGALEYLSDRLGTTGQALSLWPSAERMLDHPDLQQRLDECLELAALTGAEGANRLWERLDARDATQRQQDRENIRKLAAEFQPAGAVTLWSAYDAAAPDATERLAALRELARGLGPEKAVPAYQALEGKPGGWAQRAQSSVAAHRLSELGHADSPGKLYARISHLPAAELSNLAEHLTRGWRPEGTWAQTDELRWGRVWSDSPDGPYRANEDASLTSSYLDLRDLRNPEVRLTAAWELERGYDNVRLESSPDGKEWTPLKTFTGSQPRGQVRVPLGDFQRGFLRLRLTSDGSTQLEGLRFSDFALEGDLNGQRVARRIDARHEKPGPKLEGLLTTVLGARDPAEAVRALARTAEELGDGDGALALWPALKDGLPEERRRVLSQLTGKGGPEAALATWAQVVEPAQTLALVESLEKGGQSPSEAVWLASALAPHVGKPDLADRQAELLKLTASVGARAAARAANELEQLDPARPWVERAGLYQSARRLLLVGGTEPERSAILELYGRLSRLPTASVAELAALGERAAFTVRAEAPWKPIPGGWSDSPDANYPADADGSLTLSELSFQGLQSPCLTLRGKYELERGYDSVKVEARRRGRKWETLHEFTGDAPEQELRVDLSAFAGDQVELRLRLKTDGSTQKAGMDFTQLAVRATDRATGQPVTLLPASSPEKTRSRLIETVLGSSDPARAVRIVASGAEAVGSLDGGLALHERVREGDADHERRQLALLAQFGIELSGRLSVGSDADLEALQALAAAAGPRADLVRLWQGVQGAGKERAACLGALATELDPKSALGALGTLAKDSGRSWEERGERYLGAVALARATEQDPERLYGALAPLSQDSVRSLRGLGEVAGRQWAPSGSWGRELKPGWGQVWSDSPGRDYAPDTDASLTAPRVSLHGMKGVRAEMECEYSTERGYDQVALEIETPAGWKRLQSWSGEGSRGKVSVDLSAYDGHDVKLRLRMTSDGSTQKEGFSFRRFRLVGSDAAGEERSLPMASGPIDRRALRSFVDVALKNGDESCRLLSDLARELGDLDDALKLFRAIEPELGKPDFDKTRQALTELVGVLGGAGALERHGEFLTGSGEERLQRVRSYRLASELAPIVGEGQDKLYARLRGSTLTSGCCASLRQMASRESWEALLALGTEAERPPERRERTLELLAALTEEQRRAMLQALDLAMRAGKLQGMSPGDVTEKAIPIMLVSGSAAQAVEQVLTAGLTGIRETEQQVIVGGVVVRRNGRSASA